MRQALPLHPRPVSRGERLHLDLQHTIDSLDSRRGDLVAAGFIEDYLALDWLEWNDGALRLTVAGTARCVQQRAG